MFFHVFNLWLFAIFAIFKVALTFDWLLVPNERLHFQYVSILLHIDSNVNGIYSKSCKASVI